MKNNLLILSLLVLFSCEDEKGVDSEIVEYKIVEKNFPIIIDTINTEISHYNVEGIQTVTYPPYYFGKLKDTILIGDSINYTWPFKIIDGVVIDYKDSLYKVLNQSNDNYTHYYKFLNARHKELKESDTLGQVSVELINGQIINGQYPVLVTNNFNDTIIVGNDFHGIGLIMQAKDESGIWLNIEKNYRLSCATGLPSIVLAPNQSVVVLAPIYKGEYITQLRLKLGEFYSKPFMGTVNKNQFDYSYHEQN